MIANSGIGLAAALGVGIMLVSAMPAAAQSVGGGGKVGLTVATISSYGEPGGQAPVDPEWRTGLTAAAFVQFRITDRIGFQPEVMFSMNGAVLPASGGDATIELSDLEIPLLVTVRAASGAHVSFYVFGGVTPLFTLDAKVALEDGRDIDVDDSVKGADIAMTVGAGLQGRHWLVEARYNLGLRDIAEPDLGLDRAARRRAFAILAGLKF